MVYSCISGAKIAPILRVCACGGFCGRGKRLAPRTTRSLWFGARGAAAFLTKPICTVEGRGRWFRARGAAAFLAERICAVDGRSLWFRARGAAAVQQSGSVPCEAGGRRCLGRLEVFGGGAGEVGGAAGEGIGGFGVAGAGEGVGGAGGGIGVGCFGLVFAVAAFGNVFPVLEAGVL